MWKPTRKRSFGEAVSVRTELFRRLLSRRRSEIVLQASNVTAPITRGHCAPARRRCVGVYAILVGFFGLAGPEARASVIFDFAAQGDFTLINTNADGTVVVNNDTIALTGGNNFSLEPGTSDYVATATTTGTLEFAWSFASLDTPTFDYAGYLLNGNFFPLADTDGQFGVSTLQLAPGDSFGFRVGTIDNSGEPGVLTVAPDSIAAPEPSSAPVLFVVVAICNIFICVRRVEHRHRLAARARTFMTCIICMVPGCTLIGQTQLNYNYLGTNISGQVLLTGPQVNLLAISQQTQAQQAFGSQRPVQTEAKPRTTTRFLAPPPPLGSLSAPLAMGPMRTLQIVTASGVGFNGLTHLDQQYANNGNQYSVEPPNPSIAAGNGYVLEGVNNAVQVYTASGTPLLQKPLATNQVFGLPPAINYDTGMSGVFPTDMRVFYDPGVNRWFILQRAQCCDSAGNDVNRSQIYIAVSVTGDPTGAYNNYFIDTTDSHRAGCTYGCLADFPQIGSDQYGFYISSNEYPIYWSGMASQYPIGSTIIAISKAGLAAGVSSPVAYQFTLPYTTGYEFTITPAVTPQGAAYSTGAGGVQFFVSSLPHGGGFLGVWAMTNTSSLNTGNPNLLLTRIAVPTQLYSEPPVAYQRPGPLPYGSTQIPGFEPPIDTADCRVLSVVAAAGRLYAAFDALVSDSQSRSLAGVAYFVLSPTFRGALAASVLSQGYLVVDRNNLTRPAFGINAKGNGAIAVSLVGPDYYPSAAFAPIRPVYNSTGTLAGYSALLLQLSAAGAFPQDGFSGYEGDRIARWGDYSTAVASGDGSIWMVTEYIPNAPRTKYANWGTWVTQFMP